MEQACPVVSYFSPSDGKLDTCITDFCSIMTSSRDGIPEVQYNDVLRVTGLFLTKSNVWVLCWSNDNQFSNLTATAVRFI